MALLIIAWAGLIFVFGVGMTDAPRASYRLGPAMPAIYMLAAYGIERTLLGLKPGLEWYRRSVRPLVLICLAVWITWENYQLFFVDYAAKGDGREFALPGVYRQVGRVCDGRQIYLVAAPHIGSDVTMEVFCEHHRPLSMAQIPAKIETDRAGTFLFLGRREAAIAKLQRCYPSAQPEIHKATDGRYLFTQVDVSATAIASPVEDCGTDPAAAEGEGEATADPPKDVPAPAS